MQKIGIMGGTFNPIHYAHLTLAEFAKEQFAFDKVMFLPSKRPAHKSIRELADDSHRLAMVKLAIENNPDFYVSTIEFEREGNTYTIDTLKYLSENSKDTEYYFIIGGDSLFSFEEWKDSKQILKLCNIVAATRGEYDSESVKNKIKEFNKRYDSDIKYLEIPGMDISSHMIRQRIDNSQTVRYLTPDSVIEYIKNNKLYMV